MPYRVTTTAGLAAPKMLTLAVGWLSSFFMPVAALLLLTICFIVADFIVGLTVSYRIHHTGFTTLKAWRTVFKFAGAMTSIAAAYAIEVLIFTSESAYLARCVAGILCGFDFYSLLANFAILSNHPAFRVIKKFVKSEIESKTRRAESLSNETNQNQNQNQNINNNENSNENSNENEL
jgi:hypothetical protein